MKPLTILLCLLSLSFFLPEHSHAQTTINLADQCNCEVLSGNGTPTTGSPAASPGNLYIDNNTGNLYSFDGSSWTVTSSPSSDNQNIVGSTLSGNNLTIGIEDGNNQTIDLTPLVDNEWHKTGNAGIFPNSQFLGTTDNTPIPIRVNNLEKLRIETNGTISTVNTGYSVFIGQGAGAKDDLSDNLNVFIGNNAGNENTSGSSNVAIGESSLSLNTTGTSNTATGTWSLRDNTTGNANTATGISALRDNTTGFQNTANGTGSLGNNITGAANTAIGVNSLRWNTTGDNNTGNGYYVLSANTAGIKNSSIGSFSLGFNTTGSNNTANGYRALHGNTTGSNNVAIGFHANENGTYDNAISIGATSNNTASNQARIGNTSISSIGGYANWTSLSDGRFKKNIKDDVLGIDFIMNLIPITYQLDLNKVNSFLGMSDSSTKNNEIDRQAQQEKEAIVQSGFIAQDVENAALKSGYNFSGVDKPKNNKDHYGLRYAEFVVPLVKATQEQQAIIEQQKDEINDLKKRLELLEKIVLENK